MKYDNEIRLEFLGISQNEAFARAVVAAFVAQLNPTLSELSDIKTAVSEAVTNAIIHGYEGGIGQVYLFCGFVENKVYIEIRDNGKGMEDIALARQPLFTSKPELERSGMGFTVMEAFMDEVIVESKLGQGSTVTMVKQIEPANRL